MLRCAPVDTIRPFGFTEGRAFPDTVSVMLEKTFDAADVEPRIAALWDEAGAFKAGAGAKPDPAPDPRPPTRPPKARIAPPPARRRTDTTRQGLAALWARVALGVVLGAMITQWPYPHACGWGLLQYFGAVAMVMVTGAWIAAASWLGA